MKLVNFATRMSFVYPAFLFAASLIAIPVIIHLFNFRRYKTVYFTNVRFLKEVKEETTSRSKLKHLLVLFSRILAFLFLVLAFAQPFIPVSNASVKKEGSRAVSIYIDNSFSMSAEQEGEGLLNRAKQKAREIISAYSAAEKFQLLTNDFEGRHQRFLSRDEVLGMLDEVKPSAQVRSLKDVVALQKKVFSETGADNDVSYIITDFQKNAGEFQADTTMEINLVPLQPEEQHNLFVDTAWFDKPVIYSAQTVNLLVKVTNFGDEPVENNRISLNINGQEKAIGNFTVAAGNSVTDTLSFTVQDTGWQQAEISIIDDPVIFDDKYYMAFRSIGQINVLAINQDQPDAYLTALFSAAEKFTLANQGVRQLDYSRLGTFSLIVLNKLTDVPSGLVSELEAYLAGGGVVAVFPDAKANTASYNQFLATVGANPISGLKNEAQTVSYLNKEHEIFKDVFEEVPDNMSLPNTRQRFTFAQSSRSSEQKLLGFRDGGSFVSEFKYKGGRLFVCASPLDKNATDFPVHGLFVPMLYKMSVMGGQIQPVAYTLGDDKVVEINNVPENTEAVYKMRNAANEFIPQQRRLNTKMMLSVGDRMLDAGVYSIEADKDKVEGLAAFNYNRTESALNYYTVDELSKLYAGPNIHIVDSQNTNFGELVRELDQGVALWKLCIILALLFIAAEVLLLRFLK